MKKGMKMEEKRFSFLPTLKERKAESHTFGSMLFALNTSQHIAKIKEPNFAIPNLHDIFNLTY